MYPVEHEPVEQRAVDSPVSGSTAFGPLLAVLSALAGAWLAAGSTGLLAHPLRRVAVLVALVVALLAPGVVAWRPRLRVLLTSLVACVAVGMIALSSPAANVLAAALVLAFVAGACEGRNKDRDSLLAASTAVAVFGLYVVARTAIPSVWQFADALGRTLGGLAGAISRRPLDLGATFAGVDFLLLTIVFWSLYFANTSPPRKRRAACGFLAIFVGHLAYLVALSYVPDLLAAIPESAGQDGAWLAG